MGASGADGGRPPEVGSTAGGQPIREVVAELKAVVANAPISLFAFNTRGIITFIDGRGLRDLGIGPDEVLGQSVYDLWPQSPLATMAGRALRGETCSSLNTDSDLGRTFETNYSPMFAESGEVTGAIGVAIDVTPRLEAERAQAESEAKSRFLAGMSHELRTPLNSVLGFAQLLQQPSFGDLNERQSRYVGHILESGKYLLDLVNDVLDLARIASGKLDLRPEQVRLGPLVQSIVADMRPLVESAGLTITVGPIDTTVLADARATHQILVNLLSNAIKFTPAGGSVEVRSSEGGLEVADTGPGIPSEFLPRLFDEFSQFDPATTGNRKGSGLGLSLSRGLAEAMGGRMSVESEVGRGSTFRLTLPRAG